MEVQAKTKREVLVSEYPGGETYATRPFIYLGGAVDIGEDNHAWRHDPQVFGGLDVYCPICMSNQSSDTSIIDSNMRALKVATDAFFRLDSFSIGTPIEVWKRVMEWHLPALLLTNSDGVFIREFLRRDGVEAIQQREQVRLVLIERLNAADPF